MRSAAPAADARPQRAVGSCLPRRAGCLPPARQVPTGTGAGVAQPVASGRPIVAASTT